MVAETRQFFGMERKKHEEKNFRHHQNEKHFDKVVVRSPKTFDLRDEQILEELEVDRYHHSSHVVIWHTKKVL